MNIIFFIGSLTHGGAEGVVATLTKELSKRGHHVSLVSNLRGQVYEISPNVNLIDARVWQYDTFVGPFIVRIYKKVANRFLDYFNIKRIVKQEKPDVVISFLVNWLWQLILICKWRIPLISAERNAMEYPHTGHNFYNKQILYRLVYAVQVMSRHDKAWLRGRYKRVYPMPNPLRFDPLSQDQYSLLFGSRKNILACGRIDPQKGYEKLITAFSGLASKYPSWDIDICGQIENEEYYSQLCDLINKMQLENRVHFLGPRKDIDRVMQSHSVFCLSSQHEGFPNVLSEAMANGMACVSFDIVTGPSEIINDGLDGIIVEDQNVEELADGLARLMNNPDLRYSLGSYAITNICRFKCDTVVDKWEKLFSSIVKNYHSN